MSKESSFWSGLSSIILSRRRLDENFASGEGEHKAMNTPLPNSKPLPASDSFGHLRHPQLLDPPSICPACGGKSWQRITPDDTDPRYECLSCRWPNRLLAACPLCGADDEHSQEYDHTPDGPRVQCACGLAAPYGHDMDDARDEWNALAARVAANDLAASTSK